MSRFFDRNLAIPLIGTNLKVYGRFQGSSKNPLLIFVHGLTGNLDEGFYRAGIEYFAERGYATFRFNLYGWQKDARKIIDTSLETQAQDLDTVVKYFRRKKFSKVFLAGHSYGGATILLTDPSQVNAAVLWDPSHGVTFTKEKWGSPPATYIKSMDGYLLNWGIVYVLGQKMVHEADRIDWDGLAEKFRAPTRIICAGKGVLKKGCRRYYKTLPGKKDLKIIPEATHYFGDKPGMEEKVFKLSHEWLKRF